MASPAAASQQYRTTATVNLRSGPGTNNSIVGSLPSGASIAVVCQSQGGTNVGGNATWDKLDSGAWISDYYTTSPSFNSYAPGLGACGSPPDPACGKGGTGSKCVHVNPSGSGCDGKNATNVKGGTVGFPGEGPSGSKVTLRWSTYCKANWAHFDDTSIDPRSRTWWVETQDGHREYEAGATPWSYMVDGTQNARVCTDGNYSATPWCTNWY